MQKDRISMTKVIKDALFKEYHHRCAICNSENPHIHHIDDDPSNNDIMNLIPLCPNCHLQDHHDPTKHIEQEKLKWFRKYKDPSILKPEFHPLYIRLLFFNSIEDETNITELQSNIEELSKFIEGLNMGKFYSTKIRKIAKKPAYVRVWVVDSESAQRNKMLNNVETKEYLDKINKVKNDIFALVFEVLRYQDWIPKS